MLNIGKLAAGGEGYYLETVASGVEDYYTGAGEAPGYWLGAAAGDLGLEGRVEPETLRAVLGALDPASGAPLTGRASRRSVPGFDLTFRAPKSVSLLHGLGDAATSRAVRDAHDAAVAAAIGYLERHAAFSRRGHGGAERVPVRGFVAAAFRHRTSRAGDPLLHTHVLVANVARALDDGRWRTLDGRQLYVHAKTAGYLYQAHLRAELTRRLGVEWRHVRTGCADLDGVPDGALRAFSRRRAEIEAHMAARGESSAKAAQIATLATRRAKTRHVDGGALGVEWQTRAAALGFGPDQVAALTGRTVAAEPDVVSLAAAARELAGPEGLTARASTFTRRDAIRGWCERLPAGASVDDVLALADRLLGPEHAGAPVVRLDHAHATAARLAGGEAIRRQDDRVIPAHPGEARHSTTELLALEQRTLNAALARRHAGVGIADPAAVQAALERRPTMSGEQAAMVRRLAASGAGVEVVVGKAGAGKTFALDAAREAWQASGVRVVGCALAARAAAELQAGSGIASHTIDALLARADRHAGGLPARSVVVVDEAGMVGTRKLARLLHLAEQAAAKVVLVGDHRQLPEIDAGGVFRGLVHRLPAIELLDNRRQDAAWERAALDQLRDGEPSEALDAYQAAGRIHVDGSAEALRERLVGDWWHANLGRVDGDGGVMIALRTSDVEDLNRRARARAAATGRLTGPALAAASGREFQAGDSVVCLRNDRRIGVVNGTRATVTAVDLASRTITARLDTDGRDLRLPGPYIDAGHLTHGYAITAHKAQGMTTDRAWVLGSDRMYREWGYVAMSRGRSANHLYLVAGRDQPDDGDQPHHLTAIEGDDPPVERAATLLARRRAQQLASDQPHSPLAGVANRVAAVHRDRLDRQLARLARQRSDAAEAYERLRSCHWALEQGIDRSSRRRGTRRRPGPGPAGDLARLSGDLEHWRQRIRDLDAVIGQLRAQRASCPHGLPNPVGTDRPTVDNQKVLVRARSGRADDLGVDVA